MFIAKFSFIPTTPGISGRTLLERQPGLSRGLAYVLGGSGRYSAGIQVSVADTPEVDGAFAPPYDVALLKNRTVPHTIGFWIKVNPGPDNDLVRISVDGGGGVGQCFTTWENYYRTAPEQAPPPNVNTPADINSLQFRSSVPGFLVPPPVVATCSTT